MDLVTKLQIKAGQTVAVIAPPTGFELPATPSAKPHDADVVIGFAIQREVLSRLGAVVSAATDGRVAWIGYPKGRKMGTDLNRDLLVEAVSPSAIHPVRQVAIDDTWSALRFVAGS